MPPWLDSPEEVGAVLVGVLGALATIGVAVVGTVAAVIAAYRAKIKPLLTGTRSAAEAAAHQLQNNSGSSTRDAVDRIERAATESLRLAQQNSRDVRYLRGDVANWQNHNNSVHEDHGTRLRSLETPHERTLP